MSYNLNVTTLLAVGHRLFRGLGTFWTRFVSIFTRDLARKIQDGISTAASQLEIDANDALPANSRYTFPVYNHMRWYPVHVVKQERDLSNVNYLFIGDDREIGDGAYIGERVKHTGYVCYPLIMDPSIKTPPSILCASPFNDDAVLVNGVDFVIRDRSIILRDSDNPFNPGSPYRVYTELGNHRATLWMYGLEYDDSNVYENVGYAVGYKTRSTPQAKEVLNAVWDAYTLEASLGSVLRYLGALYDIPVCKDEFEVVEVIDTVDRTITTNSNAYQYQPGDTVRVQPGGVIRYGDPLVDRVQVIRYPFTELTTGEVEVPYNIQPSVFGDPEISDGTRLVWGEAPYLGNGVFGIFEDDGVSTKFWRTFWARLREVRPDLDDAMDALYACLSPYIIYNESDGGILEPTLKGAEWWLKEIVRNNTVIIIISRGEGIPKYLSNVSISSILPPGLRLLIIEKIGVSDDLVLDMTDDGGDIIVADGVGTNDFLSISDKVVVTNIRR